MVLRTELLQTADLRPGVGAGQVPGLLIFCVSNRMPNSWFLHMESTVNISPW